MDIQTKLQNLKSNIESMNKLIIAFSGGVDSTFLLKVASDVLKDNIIPCSST
ncbi:hypothetical protein [Clostridium drakei]|uniref:hypothetical protein n=1 Tax=Clostridium drakei TaxID=332101 RepID=UPI000A88BACF|nr:hypothetical protein [Clostridium drakei]